MKKSIYAVVMAIALSTTAAGSYAADLMNTKKYAAMSPLNTLRAVSALNGKLDLAGGAINGDGVGFAQGAVSIPVGDQFGLQFDGLAGTWNSNFIAGFAGHGFWRNPNFGLAGIYSSYTYSNQRFGVAGVAGGKGNIQIGRVGPEVELYLGKVSLESTFGYEAGDIKGRFFSISDAAFYPIDNLRLAIGHRYIGGKHLAALGSEYLLPTSFQSTRPALFVEGRIGEDDYRAVYSGVRFYFGDPKKNLIDRHRQDDPHTKVPDELFAIDSAASDKKTKFRRLPVSGNSYL